MPSEECRLYGLFLIPALFFGLAGNLVIAVVPAVRFAVVGMARLWWSLYKLLHHTIYGIRNSPYRQRKPSDCIEKRST